MYFATASVHPTGPVHAYEGVWKCGEDVKATGITAIYGHWAAPPTGAAAADGIAVGGGTGRVAP